LAEDKAIIKIDNLNIPDPTKPISVFLEKISSVIGEIYKPHQIKSLARAKAEAKIIETRSQILNTKLRSRALTRFVAEEAKKQYRACCTKIETIGIHDDVASVVTSDSIIMNWLLSPLQPGSGIPVIG